MYSKITLFGNPGHPVLGAHPLTFSIATFVAYPVYPRGGNPFRFRAGVVGPGGPAILLGVLGPGAAGFSGVDGDPKRRGRHDRGLSPA